MEDWTLAVLAGAASGGLALVAQRVSWLAWMALAPLGLAMIWCTPAQASVAGAIGGALGSAASVARPPLTALLPITVAPTAIATALGMATASWLLARGGQGYVALALPAVAIAGTLPLRLLGAPRWVASPLACTQERRLAVVHTARLGGEEITTGLLALAGASIVLVITGQHAVAAAAAALVLAAIVFGAWSVRRADRRVAARERVRVAAVVADGPPPPAGEAGGLWPIESAGYRDVERTVERYAPLVARAAREGARLIVLPEVCVSVTADTRPRWTDAVVAWARAHRATIVAPFFDASGPVNTLVIADERGVAASYDKQHPGRGLEPPPRAKVGPGPIVVQAGERTIALSTVICVDLDYRDLIGPARAGDVLAAPSNDWFGGFEVLHHHTAVWAAALSGTTIVRATGHGISSVYDGAGRVIASASSRGGPVVLVADAPIGPLRVARQR